MKNPGKNILLIVMAAALILSFGAAAYSAIPETDMSSAAYTNVVGTVQTLIA